MVVLSQFCQSGFLGCLCFLVIINSMNTLACFFKYIYILHFSLLSMLCALLCLVFCELIAPLHAVPWLYSFCSLGACGGLGLCVSLTALVTVCPGIQSRWWLTRSVCAFRFLSVMASDIVHLFLCLLAVSLLPLGEGLILCLFLD